VCIKESVSGSPQLVYSAYMGVTITPILSTSFKRSCYLFVVMFMLIAAISLATASQ